MRHRFFFFLLLNSLTVKTAVLESIEYKELEAGPKPGCPDCKEKMRVSLRSERPFLFFWSCSRFQKGKGRCSRTFPIPWQKQAEDSHGFFHGSIERFLRVSHPRHTDMTHTHTHNKSHAHTHTAKTHKIHEHAWVLHKRHRQTHLTS